LATEDVALEKAQRLLIHDTNLLSSIIYAKYYFETELSWVNDHFSKRRYSLYLLCMPDIPWEADEGQRESPLARSRLHHTFKTQLNTLKLPHLEVCGSQEARLRQAIMAVDQLFEH